MMNYINRHDKLSYAAKYGTGRYILCYEKVTKSGVPRKGARRKIVRRYETMNSALNGTAATGETRNVRFCIYDQHWSLIWQQGGNNGN